MSGENGNSWDDADLGDISGLVTETSEQPKDEPKPDENDGDQIDDSTDGSTDSDDSVDDQDDAGDDQSDDDEQNANADDSGDTDDESSEGIELDGQSYSAAEIREAFEAHKNQKDWKANQTQRDQELSAQRSKIAPVMKLISDVLKPMPESTLDEMRQAAIEEHGEDAGEIFDQALAIDDPDYEDPKDVQLAQAQFNHDLLKLQVDHGLTAEEAKEIADTVLKRGNEEGEWVTLEQEYQSRDYERTKKTNEEVAAENKRLKAENQALKKKGKVLPPKLPSKGKGAKSITKGAPGGRKTSVMDVELAPGEYNFFT